MAAPSQSRKLRIIDHRTGLTYEMDVCERGCLKSSDFSKIKAGGDGKGLKLYDPGFVHTAPVKSTIAFIDGRNGILRYRGYPVEELAERSTYLEVAYLLCKGNLPTKSQLSEWEAAIQRQSSMPEELLALIGALPRDSHPKQNFATALYALISFNPDANPLVAGHDLYKTEAAQNLHIIRIMGKAASLAGAIYVHMEGQKPIQNPNNSLNFSEMILYMFQSMGDQDFKPNPALAKALDVIFVILAEHELGTATAATLHLASSGVDVYTAIAGGTSALSGPNDIGAVEAVLDMLNEIGSIENVAFYIEEAKKSNTKLPGIGHRVYKTYDPRAKLIQKLAEEVYDVVGKDPLVEVAAALENAIIADEYFINRKLYPNATFHLGLLLRALGFPKQFFVVLVSIARIAGQLAHWKESMNDPSTRLMRPQQWYTGQRLRHYSK
ncbi:citrate synthase, glyoxysomal isoform X2 [Selaginella moellendorffii]|uniref:citrate synthase, glyoxysomal isoform X2 n=1 Tax=Selaginella moellendorffii TaxID=88036 RepID=UPI000D1C3252|nr:citrate synthase, glyoxysomal isoform X2 [Selaginella moellendorffii]|eukprot:XP_024531005.1 citrate synthase, glyoxysomal isoform X2 [Selaginella moellendorffii]